MGLAPRWVTVWVVAAAAILTLLFAFHTRQRVVWNEQTRHSASLNDFARWHVMLPQFLQHHADYVGDDFPNPPVTLIFLAPFARLSAANAQFLWVCSKAIMVAGIFFLCRLMVRSAGVELAGPAIWLILAAWLWAVVGDIQEGQTNLLMLLPLVSGLALTQLERWSADWFAGLLIALSVSIKVTPLIFIPYLVFRRRWAVAVASTLGLIVWLVVVPGLAFGWAQNLRWLGQWYHIMIEPYVGGRHVEYVGGQSLASLISRTLRRVPPITVGGGREAVPYYFNVVDLPEPIVGWIIWGVLLTIVVAGVIWARRPLRTFRSRRYVIETGVIAAFMLWASERTWVPHYVTLVLTLFAAGMVLSDPVETAAARRRARWALIVSACLMALTGDLGKIIFGPHGNKYTRTLGVSFWSSVLLVAAIVRAGGASTPQALQPCPAAAPRSQAPPRR